jgi:hypothetical protein
MHQQVNQAKQKLDGKQNKPEDDKKEKMSRGKLQREKKRKKRESGEEEAEEKAKLEAQAMREAKKEYREQKAEEKEAAQAAKGKGIKPPKKKKKVNKEEQVFDKMVDTYRSTFDGINKAAADASSNPRADVKEKRWFE